MPKPIYRTNLEPSGENGPLAYSSQTGLLSEGELRFYRALSKAVGDRYLINLKTRLTDIISADSGFSSKDGRKISQRHVDFVLADKLTARIVMVIELDDSSHAGDRLGKDRYLDDALHHAGIPIARFPIYKRYYALKIAYRINQLLEEWPTDNLYRPSKRAKMLGNLLVQRFSYSAIQRITQN